jgi:hypothetical protein
VTDKFRLSKPGFNQQLNCRSLLSFVLASLLLLGYGSFGSGQAAGAEDGDEGQTEPVSEKPSKHKRILEGGVQYLVPKGTPFKLKLATVPTNGMRLLDRDMEGNLYPAKLGQIITAKTSEDIYVDDHKVVPEGTVFHGQVAKLVAPRRLHRDGWLQISFDSFTTPDGRTFAFRAQADNFRPSTTKSKAKETLRVLEHAAGGAIVGTLVAYQLMGMHETIAMHGYNLAAGAGGGAILAAGFALADKGANAVLEPGDDMNMQIDTDLLMPGAVEATAKAGPNNKPGVQIKIASSKIIGDGFGGHILRVDISVDNQTDESLNSIDLFAEDSNGTRMPLVAGPEDTSEFLFEVEPHSTRHEVVNFEVEFHKLKRQLVWLDHNSRDVCWRGPIP